LASKAAARSSEEVVAVVVLDGSSWVLGGAASGKGFFQVADAQPPGIFWPGSCSLS